MPGDNQIPIIFRLFFQLVKCNSTLFTVRVIALISVPGVGVAFFVQVTALMSIRRVCTRVARIIMSDSEIYVRPS